MVSGYQRLATTLYDRRCAEIGAAKRARNRGHARKPGGTATMQDYLAREVLSQQPDTFRHGLLSSAILDRFCAPLCETVCKPGGGSDGGADDRPGRRDFRAEPAVAG